MRNQLTAILLLTTSSFILHPSSFPAAQDDAPRPIRFARQPSLSPDGTRIAFAYQGDIWTVPAAGGVATRLTLHEAHDQAPAWSPDGKKIAFSSKREGNYDVWVISASGGKPKRWTFHSADDLTNGWSPDGKEILFTSSRETTRTASVYAVSVENGATRLIASDDIRLDNPAFSPDGKWVACAKGGGSTRKRYRGSGNSNLLLYPAQGGAGQWLAKEPENERWPLFAPDGKTVYFVSDKDFRPNLWRKSVSGGGASPVTRFADGDLFNPTISRDGARIVFERNFSLWALDTKGGDPKQLAIYAPADDRTNSVRRETFTTGAQEFALSPDGRRVAFVVHGEIFVEPVGGGEATRITETPQREEDVSWSPDGKSLAFASDRDGNQDIFIADVATKAVRQLTKTTEAEEAPRFAPDGKTVAFLRGANGAELCVVPAEGGEAKTRVHDPAMSGVEWSPDSKWIAYQRTKAHSAGSLSDVFIVGATDGKPVNVTRYPGANGDPFWSSDGQRLFFRSSRTANMNLYSVRLQDDSNTDAADEGERGSGGAGETAPNAQRPTPDAPKEVKIDFEDIHKRATQITRVESGVGAFALSPDGRTLIFSMSQLGRSDLWRIPSAGGSPTRLTQSGESGGGLQFTSDGGRVVYLSGGALKSLSLGGGPAASAASGGSAPTGPRGGRRRPGGEEDQIAQRPADPAAPQGSDPTTLSFSARMDVDTRAELTQMFDEAWRKMRDGFYDEKMHGADWNKVRDNYRPVVEDLTYKEDFYTLFSLVLGELNASHVGISGATGGGGGGEATASLGVAFDDSYKGPGVRVAFVMPKGPADRDSSRLNVGDILLKMDGQALATNEGLYALLADKSGKRVELLVNKEPKEEGAKTVKIRPISTAAYKQLEYDRWVKEREQATEKLSNGRLGYLHLSAMSADNLEKFKRAVFGDMQEKDGLVLDLRFNGGGSIADEIFDILQDKVFGWRTIRGDPVRSTAPLPAWTKPMIVLINEASFSNAEVFPWGFKALGLGKIVGVPTFGGVIGTGGTTLIDGTSLRMPALGSYTLDGRNMENFGCPPDIYVEQTPEDILARHDRQLERAVQELMKSAGR